MPVQAWVTLAVAVLGTMWSVAVWLVGRRLNRTDELEKAVSGPGGLAFKMQGLITREEFREHTEKLEELLKGISEEGQHRESRIRDHVDQGRRSSEQDMREIRRELSEIHRRVDATVRLRR